MTRPHPTALAALLIAACGGEPDSAGDAAEAVTPSEYSYTPDDDVGGDLDVAAVEGALDAMFADILALNARHVVDSYDAMMADADESCPGADDYDGYSLWINACTADSGAYYYGYAYDLFYEDYDLGGGTIGDYTIISGTADLTAASGHFAHIGGTAQLIEAVGSDGALFWMSSISGSFFSELPAYADTWLGTGDAPSLTIQAVRYDKYDLNLVSLVGSFAMQGEVTAVSTENLGIYSYNELYGDHNYYPCAEEPAGALAFRDAGGTWYEVTFDVNPDTLAVDGGGTCDGCGMVTRDGAPVGEICIDASTLVDWESMPW